jgi:Holliday junction resolvase RusA-like endonuclease
MTRIASFAVYGPPQGKGRARSTRTGHHYTPAETVGYETRLAWMFRQAAPDWVPLDGPVRLTIGVVYDVPESWSKRKQKAALDGGILPTVKPDWDNIGKIVSDALNGVAWKDDKQITSAVVTKWYGIQAALRITVQEVGPYKEDKP